MMLVMTMTSFTVPITTITMSNDDDEVNDDGIVTMMMMIRYNESGMDGGMGNGDIIIILLHLVFTFPGSASVEHGI